MMGSLDFSDDEVEAGKGPVHDLVNGKGDRRLINGDCGNEGPDESEKVPTQDLMSASALTQYVRAASASTRKSRDKEDEVRTPTTASILGMRSGVSGTVR